ncbi:MAG: class IV adenylate cyclase [Williamsia sp.]|nr:class IV adenylate cyclase [Williamsia sp.]
MNIRTIECKARVDSLEPYEEKLQTLHPRALGLDHQVDTYFNAPRGRLKLREGNIEYALIHYDREDVASTKQSHVILFQYEPDDALKEILRIQLGIKAVVDKQRRIYFVDNVKFHFDTVAGLGHFIEVEAIDEREEFTREQLEQQCEQYIRFFGLDRSSLVDKSYADLVSGKQ